MKLYADYLKERENIECKYNEYMFTTYKIYDDNTASIIDIYADPQVRKKGVMLDFIVNVLEVNIVNRSLLNVSIILLPETPFHNVADVGTSPFADLTINIRNVAILYLSFNSNIHFIDNPVKVILSPTLFWVLTPTGSLVPCVVANNAELRTNILLCPNSTPSLLLDIECLVSNILLLLAVIAFLTNDCNLEVANSLLAVFLPLLYCFFLVPAILYNIHRKKK